MKTFNIVLTSLFFGFASLPVESMSSAMPVDTDYAIKESGANHRVWQRTTYEQGPNGTMVPHVHSYTELAAGLNYKDASTGQWVESKELIEPFSNGAVARQGQHQVIFANNLNSAGAIDMQTTDGKRLRSNILGLMYYDPSTGDAVIIARLQDSEGELIADNRVLYPNAFDGVNADVQYTYKRDGFEQDVILREQPPAPEVFGFDPQTTELEVFTEFIDPPSASVVDTGSDEQGLEPDQEVKWGATSLGRGKAFNLGAQDFAAEVSKRYVTIQGRHFLLEKVLLRDIKAALSKLPEQAANPLKLPVMAVRNPSLPKTPLARSGASPMRLASSALPEKGYVLDYVTVNASLTNYTFQSDTTYYVSGLCFLSGTTTIEGGAVLKYATNGNLSIYGSINCRTGPYRPAVFTAKDDNTVGEAISGATGSPSGYYGSLYVSLGGQQVSGVRILYSKTGISSGYSLTINNAQFVKCGIGVTVGSGSVTVNNALFSNVNTNFYVPGTVTVINTTFNNQLRMGSGITLRMTNCVLANVTNMTGTIYAGYNGFYRTTMFGDMAVTNTYYPFQTIAGGNFYLTNGCNFSNAGTTNIASIILADLKLKTTCSPIAYSNTSISVVTTFTPQARRDASATLDLGYHYDPLDYVFGGVTVNTNLTFASGTATGWFSGGNGSGITLASSGNANFNGTASLPCIFARYSTVQEGGNGIWTNMGSAGGISGGSAPNQIAASFTRFALLANDPKNISAGSGQMIVSANNCEFWNGTQSGDYAPLKVCFTNCLFERSVIKLGNNDIGAGLAMQNCTIRGGALSTVYLWTDWVASIFNCAFDGTVLSSMSGNSTNTYCDNNAFLNGAGRLPLNGSHDVIATNSFNWQSSWFGKYYLPTNSLLIDAGSTNADLLAFYHFTTQTNQMKEATSIVDIGYHYVAVDGNGNLLDIDGDGIPDYLEDSNGNGIFDAGDLGNWLISPYNGLSSANGLSVFTPLK